MNAHHTPLPWHRTHNTLNVFADGYKAAIAATFSYEYRESGPSKEEAEANAAFIFRACNAHNELVSALRPFAKWGEGFGPYAREDSWVIATTPSGKTLTMGDIRSAVAALAGEEPRARQS